MVLPCIPQLRLGLQCLYSRIMGRVRGATGPEFLQTLAQAGGLGLETVGLGA